MNNLLEANLGLMDAVKAFISELEDNKKKRQRNGNNPKSMYLNGSISNYTKNLVLTFPMLCDNSLPPSTASMLSRANERQIVTMLEMLFASMSINGTSGAEVLAQIHKNIKVGMSLDDTIDALDDFIDKNLNESSKITPTQAKIAIREMVNYLKVPQHSFPVSSFSETSLNDYLVYNMHGTTVVKEYEQTPTDDDLYRYYGGNATGQGDSLQDVRTKQQISNDEEEYRYKRNIERQYKANEERRKQAEEERRQNKYEYERDVKRQYDANEERRKQNNYEYERDVKRQYNANEERRKQNEEERRTATNRVQIQNMRNQNTDYQVNAISRQLLDTDIKKANEMQPTLMVVRFNELDNDGSIYSEKPFVAGVKSRLIGVETFDIIDRIIVKNKTKVNFLNFIRATTGEIKFFKDFIFCIDQAKIDAKNAVKKGEAAQMWKVLETRSSKNYMNKHKRAGNDASAITTLVLNQETVNILKKEYDFDIEKPKNARMILDAYNLLGIMIADESVEVVKFLYAGNDMYEMQSYSYLQKESNDNSYKKVINLIGKMNGR